jgi:hypothetical protein
MKASLINVEVKENYLIHLTFSDGLEGDVDLSEHVGKGVFSKWSDYQHFRAARIGEFGELVWDGELDFCPDSLYMEVSGQSPEVYFQKPTEQHA